MAHQIVNGTDVVSHCRNTTHMHLLNIFQSAKKWRRPVILLETTVSKVSLANRREDAVFHTSMRLQEHRSSVPGSYGAAPAQLLRNP